MTSLKRADWGHIMQHRIEGILKPVLARGEQTPPIDLESLGESFHVLEIQQRPMIPEASTEAIPGGFRIYLRDNFLGTEPTTRQRFTLAHEFCHTLFYDWSTTVPKRIKYAPVGENVESLCHSGAGLLLVPPLLLRRELKLVGGTVTARDVPCLASKFTVSVEAMLRRLQEETTPPTDRAIILVGSSTGDGTPHILGWFGGPWIRSHFSPPKIGTPLAEWLGTLSSAEAFVGGDFQCEVLGGTIAAGAPVPLLRGRVLRDLIFQCKADANKD